MACEEKKDKGDMEEEEKHDLGSDGQHVKRGANECNESFYVLRPV